MKVWLAVAAIMAFAAPVQAQSLSPDEIRRMVDERIDKLNPYQALLNDPDPARSLAAMQIMLESGDKELVRMALEFGILSPNPTVKRTAFEGWLTNAPILSIRFDGSGVKDKQFPNIVRSNWNGTINGTVGYWRIAVGNYLPEHKCYANTVRPDRCFITVNSDGIFLTADYLNARGTIAEDGQLTGSGSMYQVDEPVPFSIQLID